ncbi:TPA: hypothetical protein ACXN3T_002560 [Proteus mirabilis]
MADFLNQKIENKVLMLVPSVFNYSNNLEKSLSKICDNYICLNERPSNTFFMKAGLRINISPLSFLLTYSYYNHILKKIIENFIDTVLIINPEATPVWFVKKLRKKKIKIIYYLWDSIKNKPQNKKLLQYANHVWSFDHIDCKEYKLSYKPLFYSTENNIKHSSEQYDLSFIGTLHGDRYEVVNKIFGILNSKKTFKFFYCPSKRLFFFNKFFSKKWANVNISDVSFDALDYSTVEKIMNNSSVILDVHSSGQNGLTMRTIETLGKGKKILTTNDNIKVEYFYDDKFIMCFDRNRIEDININKLNEFILIKGDLNLNIREQHIDHWLRSLFID